MQPAMPESSPEADKEEFKAKLRSLNFGRVKGGARESSGKPRPVQSPSWEKGIAGEHRPDGSFMPYLSAEQEYAPIGVKEFGERRHEITEQVNRLKTDPDVFKAEREGK